MDTNVDYEVFEYNPETHIFEIPVNHPWALEAQFVKEMFWGGFFDGTTIYVDKFLRDDLSINLEKLELAVITAVTYLDVVTPFDDPITLYLGDLQQYYELRGIADKPKNMKEEYYVIRGMVDAVANNESIKPVKVEYVSGTADPSSRRE